MSRYKPPANIQTVLPEVAITFDTEAFDSLIKSQGVLFQHHIAIRCPVGIIDRHDTLRRPHEHHESCQNGFIYTVVGSFQALLTGNGLNAEFRDPGMADSSQAQASFPRFYSEGEGDEDQRVYLAPMDRLFWADENIRVPNWELVEAHISGRDRLSFPAVSVLQVIDSRGIRYGAGDFELVGGQVHWTGDHQPGIDPETDKGRIYSIRYLYRPFFYIKTMGHEIRVTAVEDPLTGERRIEKMPQSATIVREYVFINQENDEESASTARQHRSPASGSFGPK